MKKSVSGKNDAIYQFKSNFSKAKSICKVTFIICDYSFQARSGRKREEREGAIGSTPKGKAGENVMLYCTNVTTISS